MKTLEELKAENAAAEEEANSIPQVEEEKTETAEEETETDESGQIAESEQEETGEETSEAWMQSDEQTSQEKDAEKSFTGSDIAAAKHKLRSKLEKRHDGEVEKLRTEIKRLKDQGSTEQQIQIPPRPKIEDFNYDEEAHQVAIDKWGDARLEAKVKQVTTGQQQTVRHQQDVEAFNRTIDQHYERAGKLAEESGITAEVYQQSDLVVRSAIEQAMPDQGDLVTEQLIATLGEGSEKVMYYLGRNKNELNALQSALLADPSGMKAIFLLGRISSKINSPQKRTSRAPKPATQIRGDEGASLSADGKTLKKAYQAADKSGDAQARFNARREARKAGIDVSNW